MGVSDGFSSIVIGKRSSDEVRSQYVGSGDVVDISVGDGGDWYPVPRMPENRILLGRNEKVGEVRGETHLAAWGPPERPRRGRWSWPVPLARTVA